MTADNGLDNPLPISKEGLLAAIDTAIGQAKSASSMLSIGRTHDAALEIQAQAEYLERLFQNIKDDRCTHYEPVVRT